MPAALLKEKRESLFHEIATVMETWPEQQRQIFSLFHYSGKSPAAISTILAIGIEEVCSVLNICERQLHRSLRGFHRGRMDDTSSSTTNQVACATLQAPLSPGVRPACR